MPSSEVEAPRVGNLIKRLWCGDVTLAKTFWLYAVLLGLLTRFLPVAAILIPAGFQVPAFFALRIFAFVYAVFMTVSISRSAKKYRYVHPRRSVFAILATISCALFWIVQIVSFVGSAMPVDAG